MADVMASRDDPPASRISNPFCKAYESACRYAFSISADIADRRMVPAPPCMAIEYILDVIDAWLFQEIKFEMSG